MRATAATFLRVTVVRAWADSHPVLRAADRVGDPLVLVRELTRVVEPRDHLAEAGRFEQDVDGAQIARLVDRDEPVAQMVERLLVLSSQESELLGLQSPELSDPGEALPLQREVLLERLEVFRHAADLRLERPDPRGDVRDLRREALLLGVGRSDLVVQARDPRVDRLLVRGVVACRGRGREESEEDDEEDATAHAGLISSSARLVLPHVESARG